MEEQDVGECRRMALCQQQLGSRGRRREVGSLPPLQEGEDFGLPHHLFYKILASLPVLKLFHLRLVCKSWNSLLQSPTFLEARSAEEAGASAGHDDCWFVMARKAPVGLGKEFVAYCLSLEKWFRFPVHSSPSVSSSLGHCSVCVDAADLLDCFCETNLHFGGPSTASDIASAGGLVSCVVDTTHLREVPGTAVIEFVLGDLVLVFNPLTGAVKRLPPNPGQHHPNDEKMYMGAISMVATATDSYHVFLHDDYFYEMQIYDSRSCSWKVGEPLAAAKFTDEVLNADFFSYDYRQELLFAFTAESNEWSKIRVHCPSPCPTFLKCKDRLLVASTRAYGDSIEGFDVWELQTSSDAPASCIKVAEAPPEYSQGHLLYDAGQWTEVKFITNGSLICMTGIIRKGVDIHATRWLPPLVYDLVLDRWYHLPDYMGSIDLIGLFLFRPRLTAIICSEGNQNEESEVFRSF